MWACRFKSNVKQRKIKISGNKTLRGWWKNSRTHVVQYLVSYVQFATSCLGNLLLVLTYMKILIRWLHLLWFPFQPACYWTGLDFQQIPSHNVIFDSKCLTHLSFPIPKIHDHTIGLSSEVKRGVKSLLTHQTLIKSVLNTLLLTAWICF